MRNSQLWIEFRCPFEAIGSHRKLPEVRINNAQIIVNRRFVWSLFKSLFIGVGGGGKEDNKMWTDATREKYEREAHRYASDLSDTEWCVIEPHMPPARALGRPRKTDMREVMTAILYMARSGCQWRMLPGEFPPRSSVQYYFYKWRDDGTWQEVNRALLARTREAEGRAPAFGNWNSVFQRFRRWAKKGVFERLFEELSAEPDFEYALIDATIVSVHQKASGAKGGLKIRPSADHGAD